MNNQYDNDRTTDYDPLQKYRDEEILEKEVLEKAEVQESIFAAKTDHYDDTYRTYNEWKAQESKKPRSKKPMIVVASVVASAMLFGGGILAAIGYQSLNAENPTSINITSTPDTQYIASTGQPLTGSEIYEKVSPSVVGISSVSKSGTGTGSGIIMSSDGYIITNNHVVEDGEQISVILNDSTTYTAEVIGLDEKTDLAVLKIEPNEPLVAAEFGDPNATNVGDAAYAIGSPGGLELQNTFTGGYISAINRDITVEDRVMTLIQTDVAINPGNSGGPLINEYGQIIGINTVKITSTSYEGLGFAIPIDQAKEIVDELIINGEILGRPVIGLNGMDITEEMSVQMNIPEGVYISTVDERSDAYAKGLTTGDIVIGVNGEEVKTMSEINALKEEFEASDEITLTIYRSGEEMDVTIVLMDETALDDPIVQEEDTQTQETPYYPNLPFYFLP